MSVGIDVHMRETDRFSWTMEQDPILRMPVVAVAMLDGVPDWDEVKHRMERLTRAVPMFRQRVVPTPGGLAPPKWVVDAAFDLDWHVRRIALPPPADLDAVLGFAATMGTTPFDPIRPRWEVWLVEGLDGGAAAWVAKVHHTLTDGIGGMQLLAHVFDVDGTVLASGPVPEAPPSGDTGRPALLRSGLRHNADIAAAIVRGGVAAVAHTLDAARHDPLAAAKGVGATWQSLLESMAPSGERLSPVMTARGIRRSYATLDVPLDGLRAAGAAVGGTINDAFVTATTEGLRRYHAAHATTVPELRMCLPISIRQPGDPTAGNRMTLIRIVMPLTPGDPAPRMAEIRRRAEHWKSAPGLVYTEAAYGVINTLPAAYLQGLCKNVDFVASNVPGFPMRLHLAGPQVLAIYPYSPTGGSAVNFTLLSYAGTACIGVNIDPDAVPDLDVFMNSMRRGFDEVLAIGAPGHRRRERRQVSPPRQRAAPSAAAH